MSHGYVLLGSGLGMRFSRFVLRERPFCRVLHSKSRCSCNDVLMSEAAWNFIFSDLLTHTVPHFRPLTRARNQRLALRPGIAFGYLHAEHTATKSKRIRLRKRCVSLRC